MPKKQQKTACLFVLFIYTKIQVRISNSVKLQYCYNPLDGDTCQFSFRPVHWNYGLFNWRRAWWSKLVSPLTTITPRQVMNRLPAAFIANDSKNWKMPPCRPAWYHKWRQNPGRTPGAGRSRSPGKVSSRTGCPWASSARRLCRSAWTRRRKEWSRGQTWPSSGWKKKGRWRTI